MKLNDFLFEIGCEELPFAAVKNLASALADNVKAAFDKAQLTYQAIHPFASPRRLALLITQLPEEQPQQQLSRRGPALNAAYDNQGQPTKALLGFAKSCGVDISELTVLKTDKGEWLVHDTVAKGAKTKDLLPELINQAVAALPIAKPMRWGDGEVEFARPVHWIVMLLGEEVIPCTVLGVPAGQTTYGHRFHHPEAIHLTKPDAYEETLAKALVMVDPEKRRQQIKDDVEALATKHQAKAIMSDSLLDEVAAIVEWPKPLLASFAPEFLQVPPEALIASMQSHQKCFALADSQGKLLPHFVAVANINSTNPSQVIAGNEKVMRARLSDAAFFFDQDKKQALSQHKAATEKVVFQARLGTLADKAQRIQSLINNLITPLELREAQAHRAAELSKCDLMTGMVGEFPELQGLMGYYYALHDGEDRDVAVALNEQYLPRFSGDALPATPLGLALSLADRLDTLVGIFAIGQKPSGVKDPFKLRRHALAVVRLLLSTPARISLQALINQSKAAYGDVINQQEESLNEIKGFILERLQSFYQAKGVSGDLVQAVKARQDDWLYDFDRRVTALADFVTRPEASVLSAACKRVNNILQQAEPMTAGTALMVSLLEEGAEHALYTHLNQIEDHIKPLYQKGDYSAILNQLARLREPVDAFFDQVMVMVDDEQIRMNRLHLLKQLQTVLQGVADISLLQLPGSSNG
ncbi:glycine--tRNA ligase subunit beta [Legionella taurinensis]|uniref:Glycine--tRNA ligase beta subunit n=1 Tax=Legionella taurinensis TaxID=70611 RepID=A0A3A5L7H4_9GAMM|nr:glycine--tRNA ligase subunit beta [Legionella taurinensis]MDX1836474.1 glycine--tRNA ligase subunit beta [Legionella taurinensis]PUT43054.1 glycine--tRNA ligase subunit beta [Legionella taurinensis]PUT45128.1 glycine--tRNA ligase subunit beta [Legionella taurinensis]PUT45609.1 glycine--tRNA ligase subunit beta [Legionella taurinensis]PUT49378.1 glycine--tRNA ligase subunit beta [Legionella taurinensis]